MADPGYRVMAGKLVVNADDFGVSRGATLGIIRAHLEGVVSSASLSPTGADYPHAVQAAREKCPRLGVGLHFTLSAGKPVSSPAVVPLLVDTQGFLRWEFVPLLWAVGVRRQQQLLAQIGIELEAQLQRLKSDGIVPDHIDSERHVHLIPGIFELVIEAAVRHGIPFVRGGHDLGMRWVRPQHWRPLLLRGGLLKFLLLEGLARRGRAGMDAASRRQVQFCDGFASYLFTGRLDAILPDIIADHSEGSIEVMVHPGIPGESRDVRLGNAGLEEYLTRDDRQRELDACIDVRSRSSAVNLTTFADLIGVRQRR